MKHDGNLGSFEANLYSRQSRVLSQNPRVLEDHYRIMARWYGMFLGRHLPEDRQARILDVPCGHGRLMYALRQTGYTNVTGYDLDEGRVRIARQWGLNAHVSDAFVALAENKDVRLLASLDFIEHLEKARVGDFLRQCHETLCGEGTLIIRTPFADSFFGHEDLGMDFTHKWAACSGIVRELILDAGFRHCIIRDEAPQPVSVLHTMRVMASKVLRPVTNLWLICLGLRPRRVWASSGWLIATK
jgi:SAM-dependent methyltransferase